MSVRLILTVSALAMSQPFGAVLAAESSNTMEDDDPRAIVVTGTRDAGGYVQPDSSIAKIDAPLRDIPQTVDVVPAAVLKDQRALSIQDALKNVPGVGLSHGDGQRDQVTIRGFSAIADQFVDGFRDDALYFRDLSNVERIEVVKGPAAVLYGRGSSGGLINRVTRKPGTNIVSLTASYGSFDTKRGEIDLGQVNGAGDVAWRLTGAIERDDSFRDQQFLNREAIAPSILLGGGGNTAILVQADYLKDSRVTDFGIPAYLGRPVDVDRSTYYGAANARDADVSQSEVFSQTVTFTHRFNDKLSFRNGFRHYNYSLDRKNTLPGSVNAAARMVTLNRSNVYRDEDGWSNQAELTQTLNIAGTQHKLLYGFEIARQVKDLKNVSRNGIATVDLFNPVLPMVPVILTNAPAAFNRGVFDNRGLYAQDLIDFGGGFKALVGIRHDWFDQRTIQRIANQPNLKRKDREWSPRAGLVFQPDASQSYYLSWSRSFQPSGEAFSIAANNADIAPEQTTNKEIGAKYTLFGGALNVTASLFELKRTGIKTTDPANPTQLIPIGVQRTRGAELAATLELAAGWHAIAGYSHLDAEIIRSTAPNVQGKRATITPKHGANLFLSKSFGDRFGIGAGGNYVGDRYADPANTVLLPGYVTADAFAWYQAGPVRLQVNGYNLFDKKYIISGHGSSANLNLPGAPRSVIVTARFAM